MTRLDVCRPQTNWLAIKSQMCNAMRSVLSRRLIFRGWYLALGYSRIWVKFPRSYSWYGARYADPTSEISPQPQPPLPGFPTVLYFSNFVFLTSFGFWNCCLLLLYSGWIKISRGSFTSPVARPLIRARARTKDEENCKCWMMRADLTGADLP